jgi:uncharacterized protein YfaS (alpha-2-macroglobulin family)
MLKKLLMFFICVLLTATIQCNNNQFSEDETEKAASPDKEITASQTEDKTAVSDKETPEKIVPSTETEPPEPPADEGAPDEIEPSADETASDETEAVTQPGETETAAQPGESAETKTAEQPDEAASSETETAEQSADKPADSSEKEASAKMTARAETKSQPTDNKQLTTSKIDSIPFRVLDISERTYNGGPAISILFSKPLDPSVRHDKHLRISDPKELLKSAWVLSDDRRTLYFPHAEPETEYSVTVLDTLTSETGSTLKKRVSQTVVTRSITPIVSFVSEGFLLPAKMTDGLPLVTVNVQSVEIEFFRLNEAGLVHFVSWQNTTGRKDYYQLSQIKEYAQIVFSGRFDLNAPRNKRTVCHVPVEHIQAIQEPGVYLAVMRQPGEYNYEYQSTYFLVTDIGLHARIYANESLIIASSLSTGEPLANTELTFYDREGKSVGQGTTDAEGRYRHPEKLTDKIYLVKAVHGDHVGILPLNVPALDMSEFDLGKRPYKPREIFLYTPRDLYRPGETVPISALLRSYDGRPVQSMPLKAKLYRADNKEVRSFTWHAENTEELREFNYYQTLMELPKDAQTGLWTLKVWDNPSEKSPTNELEFHVEDFLPERMKLELSSPKQYPRPGDALEIGILGEYLYGAPAAGNILSARVRVKAKRDLLENLKGFEFGDVRDQEYKDYWELEEQTLDNTGQLKLKVPSRWQEIKSPLSVRVVASLFETGGRPVVRSIDQTVWPGKNLIGIRPLFDPKKSADEGPVTFEVVKAGPDGVLIPANNLMVDITKEDRDYYWEYSESTGWQYRYTEKHYQFLTETLRLEGERPTPYTLHLERGQYVFAVKDPETNLTTSLRFRVGYWWHDDDQGDAARPDKVLLKPDKPVYSPGDVIQLTVTPPSDGEALILVEGENPLWFKRTAVSASGTLVEIPVTDRWDSHNLYVSAVVFRPANAREKITPNRAVGLIHIPLDRSQRKIGLEINAPEKVASQGPVSVRLKLVPRPVLMASTQKMTAKDLPQDFSGQKVFVTLAAVDVGILNITEFKTPDPFGWFFEPRRYRVNSYDVYNKVIENLSGQLANLRYGGDADLGGKRPDSEVKLLSLFQEPVRFDQGGEAEVTFDLPDFNGKIRLMAVAFSSDSFGSAEAEVIVAAPTVTQLAMPRFLAPGDATEFTLDVHNLSGSDQNLNLEMRADDPLMVTDGIRNIPLADGEKTTLRFPVTAKDYYGASKIRLHLEGEGITLDRDWQLGVRPAYPAIARKIRKVLRVQGAGDTAQPAASNQQPATFILDSSVTEDLIPETLDVHLKISPVIPLDIRNAMQGLISYPYGCLEQTTSRAYPLLFATPERIAKFYLPAINHDERISRLDKAIERLSTMQLGSGGFGLWNKNSPETTWLTAYVTDFLLSARDSGLDVPDDMVDNALNRLDSYVQSGSPLSDYYGSNAEKEHLDFAVRSYAAYVLARVNWGDLGTLRTLYDNHRQQAGSSLPLAHLAIALQKMGDNRRSEDCLKLAAEKRCQRYGYWGDYGSLVRDLAQTIVLFMENGAEQTEGFDKLMLDLEEELRYRQWLSTQEKFAIFKAGIALEAQADQEWKGRLSIGGKETALRKKGPYLVSLTPEDVGTGVKFVSENKGFLYASAIVNGYTKTPPPKEDARIQVRREWYDSEGNFIERSEFKVGELVVAHLMIGAEEWIPDALVADLVPAGFELENQNLKNSVRLDDIQLGGDSLWRLRERATVVHEEYRDDRYVAVVELHEHSDTHLFYLLRAVSPGKFSVPPPFAESMYRPEIRGIGDTPQGVSVLNKSN